MNRNFLQEDVQALENEGLRRSLRTVESAQGRAIVLNGRKVLNFCSNDYLGLADDVRIKHAAQEAINQYGVGAGASRLVCGDMAPHQQLEAELAIFKKLPATLVFSSGYMANTGILSALVTRDDAVFCDKLNHASIVDGIILSRAQLKRYAHLDMQALEQDLKTTQARRKLIVTDTVFSMDGDTAPLKEIVTLAQRYEAMVMVDEAHGFGVLGPSGAGLVEELGLENQVDVQMGTLSKAVGCMGGYAAGSKDLREYLINKGRSFIYTTAMPPAWASAALAAVRIIRQEPQRRTKVLQYAEDLRCQLKALGFDTMNSTTPIIPVLLKETDKAMAMSRRLLEQGIWVQAIRPPTVPMHRARLRLTVTAGHTADDLACLVDQMKGL